MRILVTGSEGSLMQAVIPHLLDAGHTVIGVDNFARHGAISRDRPYEFIAGDLTERSTVRRAMQGCDAVIQAAATIYGVGGFHKRPATILSNDLTLHASILQGACDAGVGRVVYISSSMVYERVEITPTAENDIDRFGIPLTDYGLSKLVGERMCRAFFSEFGLEYTIWRPFNIITPLERSEGEIGTSHVFADFVDALLVQKRIPLPVLGDGEQIRCFTWIDDVARGIADHSFSEKTRNEAFNLGNPRPVTMLELGRIIFTAARQQGLLTEFDELTFAHLPAYKDDVRVRIPDVNKAREILGWAPEVDLETAVDRCISDLLVEAGAK